jgi:hypothetical protein
VPDTAPLRLAEAWQKQDFALETAAIGFWRRNDLLPPRVDERARARQLSVVAYVGDEVAGVSTLVLRVIPQVKSKLAMFRCSVSPAYRRFGVAAALAVASRDASEAWARRYPEHELKGMGCVVQGAELSEKKEQAVWPLSGLSLVGYNNRGEQIRVVWFKGATVL